MKENALDVLMYLFRNFIDGELEYIPDRESLESELLDAGFPNAEINRAFVWLDELASGEVKLSESTKRSSSIRIYSRREMNVLDTECRGFLLFLEQANVINAETRELVIDRVMALPDTDIEIERLKWIIVMVLFNQPEHENNYEWLENMVFDSGSRLLH